MDCRSCYTHQIASQKKTHARPARCDFSLLQPNYDLPQKPFHLGVASHKIILTSLTSLRVTTLNILHLWSDFVSPLADKNEL